jgi:hypothetical protein
MMTQQHLNEVKRECFAEVIKFADELEDDYRVCHVTRYKFLIEMLCDNERFFFDFSNYDTTLEAGQEFHKQFNRFKKQCKTSN